MLFDAGWAESVNRGDGGRDHCHHSQPNKEGYPVLGHRESRLVIQPLSMSGQHNVGCHHEPKSVGTYKGNIDEYRDYCEQGDNERNDMDTENVEHRQFLPLWLIHKPGSLINRAAIGADISPTLPKTFAGAKVCSFVKDYKAKQMTDNIFAQ